MLKCIAIDDDIISWGDRMSYLSDMKFNVVKREATDAARLEEAVKRWTRAVSYTHLDVYKRQALSRPATEVAIRSEKYGYT